MPGPPCWTGQRSQSLDTLGSTDTLALLGAGNSLALADFSRRVQWEIILRPQYVLCDAQCPALGTVLAMREKSLFVPVTRVQVRSSAPSIACAEAPSRAAQVTAMRTHPVWPWREMEWGTLLDFKFIFTLSMLQSLKLATPAAEMAGCVCVCDSCITRKWKMIFLVTVSGRTSGTALDQAVLQRDRITLTHTL